MNEHPNDKQDASAAGSDSPQNGTPQQVEPSLAELRATCEQLRRKIQELETARAHDRELLAIKQSELDGLLHLLEVFSPKPLSDQEFQECLRKSDCKTLEEFLPELERIVNS